MLPMRIFYMLPALLLDVASNPNTAWLTLTVAAIAAVASVTSAFIAFKSKDRDFRNEYYKRIIDKRLGAYEAVEAVAITLNQATTGYLMQGRQSKPLEEYDIHVAINTKEKYFAFAEEVRKSQTKIMWLSRACGSRLIALQDVIESIAGDMQLVVSGPVDELKLIKIIAGKYEAIEVERKALLKIIRSDIPKLRNIEFFLTELEQPL